MNIKDWRKLNGINIHIHFQREWVCLETDENKEIFLVQQCIELDIPFFLPIDKSNNSQKQLLYPGYLYVCIKEQDKSLLKKHEFVNKIITFHDQEKEIKFIRELNNNIRNGNQIYKINDEVEILMGGFQGIIGKIEKFDLPRKHVIFNFQALSTHFLIDIPVNYLSKPLISRNRNIIEDLVSSSELKINQELIIFLNKNPSYLYKISPYNFELLIADILKNFGFDIEFTPQTKDKGRDILAVMNTPLGQFLTIVECKRYAPHRKIGINYIERFMWTLTRNDNANCALMVTTSTFSKDALELQKKYNWQLKLKDINDIINWLGKYGHIANGNGNDNGLWLPKLDL